MAVLTHWKCGLGFALCAALPACSTSDSQPKPVNPAAPSAYSSSPTNESALSSFFDLFGTKDDPNVTLEVNKYIWRASLEILDFMPIESADPFSGVLIYGYGTPPGGSRAYRATVLIQDPALDARSLNLSLLTQSGPAAPDTVRAVEDAILTRARQLRIADGGR